MTIKDDLINHVSIKLSFCEREIQRLIAVQESMPYGDLLNKLIYELENYNKYLETIKLINKVFQTQEITNKNDNI